MQSQALMPNKLSYRITRVSELDGLSNFEWATGLIHEEGSGSVQEWAFATF
jgi:hypothetical protein